VARDENMLDLDWHFLERWQKSSVGLGWPNLQSWLGQSFGKDAVLRWLVLSLIDHGVTAFVETGTHVGLSCGWLALSRDIPIFTCEINHEFAERAAAWLPDNIVRHEMSSEKFIPLLVEEVGVLPLFFLDAHWRDYWPLPDEIRAVARCYSRAVMVVHDFAVPGRPWFTAQVHHGEGPQNDMGHLRNLLVKPNVYNIFVPTYQPPRDDIPGHAVIFQNVEPFGLGDCWEKVNSW